MLLTKETQVPAEVRLFHITHLGNLPSIIEAGGLLSLNQLKLRDIPHQSIAFAHLQERRDRVEVPSDAGSKTLHDYVPWQFAARPPMLFTIARGGLAGGLRQDDIVHLVTKVSRIQEADIPFVFTDGHPLSDLSKFYDNIELLPSLLDWEVLKAERWNNTVEDADRKRRRQAEFLMNLIAPWSLVTYIGVRTEQALQEVTSVIGTYTDAPKIAVVPDWYYNL